LLLQVGFQRVHAHFAAVVAELDLPPMQAKALHELDVGARVVRNLAATLWRKCCPLTARACSRPRNASEKSAQMGK
jgi:hypothetical protein